MPRSRGTAVTGETFEIEHPSLDLSEPFSSHVDVRYQGVVHQVFTAASHDGFDFENTTGTFTIGDHRGYVVEAIDTVAGQAAHRRQAIVASDTGALSVHSYASSDDLLGLLGSLGPSATPTGMAIEPDDEVEVVGAPRVAQSTPAGIIEITPLVPGVIDQLPEWSGTTTEAGELFAARRSDGSPTIVLVTTTCRAVLLVGAGVDADLAATTMSELRAVWTP